MMESTEAEPSEQGERVTILHRSKEKRGWVVILGHLDSSGVLVSLSTTSSSAEAAEVPLHGTAIICIVWANNHHPPTTETVISSFCPWHLVGGFKCQNKRTEKEENMRRR